MQKCCASIQLLKLAAKPILQSLQIRFYLIDVGQS
jgi:hypothetical protein